MNIPGKLTYEEASKMQLPFLMFEVVTYIDDSGVNRQGICPILVTRVGVDKSVGATLPSISFISGKQHCRGSLEDYFTTKEAANHAIDAGDF